MVFWKRLKKLTHTKKYTVLTKVRSSYDLTFSEVLVLTPLVVLIILLGFYPSILIDLVFSSSVYCINY